MRQLYKGVSSGKVKSLITTLRVNSDYYNGFMKDNIATVLCKYNNDYIMLDYSINKKQLKINTNSLQMIKVINERIKLC